MKETLRNIIEQIIVEIAEQPLTPREELAGYTHDLQNIDKFQTYEDAVVKMGEIMASMGPTIKAIREQQRIVKATARRVSKFDEGPVDEIEGFEPDINDYVDLREMRMLTKRCLEFKGKTQRLEKILKSEIARLRRTTLSDDDVVESKSLREDFGSIGGKMRSSTRGGKQQYKIGKVEDQNRELSAYEAESMFPGATEAWAEIVPELFPDYPFNDPRVIRNRSLWFKIGGTLRVAFEEAPQAELAEWDPLREDWIEMDLAA